MTKLKNKIVFISGASSGIGKACANAFAAEGAKLILAARRKDRLEQLASELKEKFDSETKILSFDIQNYKEIKESFSSLPEEWKNVDILINSAGLAQGMHKLQEGNPDDWDVMINTYLSVSLRSRHFSQNFGLFLFSFQMEAENFLR